MSITRKEELILLSILNLKDNAYLIAIQDHLVEVTGKKVSLTSVHLPLSRLEKEGLIESFFGEATAVRGGRRKKIYMITEKGIVKLNEYKKINDVLWADYSKLVSR
ncbi:MAG: PadR family transcriptional regulator [bacterium]|nr:PadR family transcriptional regulator [bacterium]